MVWATRKQASLEGQRMLVVQPMTFAGADIGSPIIALDTVNAGVGSRVIYVTSTEATIPFKPTPTAVDATIVGILDRVDHNG
jgi:ethanolamine utilization protein EutN